MGHPNRIMKTAIKVRLSISGTREDGPATKSLLYLIYPLSHFSGATGLAGKTNK